MQLNLLAQDIAQYLKEKDEEDKDEAFLSPEERAYRLDKIKENEEGSGDPNLLCEENMKGAPSSIFWSSTEDNEDDDFSEEMLTAEDLFAEDLAKDLAAESKSAGMLANDSNKEAKASKKTKKSGKHKKSKKAKKQDNTSRKENELQEKNAKYKENAAPTKKAERQVKQTEQIKQSKRTKQSKQAKKPLQVQLPPKQNKDDGLNTPFYY